MDKCKVRNTQDALAYIADCTLATVCSLAMKKSRSKSEYKRQISIAQTAVNWMKEFNVDPIGTRAEEIKGGMTVEQWAKQFERV